MVGREEGMLGGLRFLGTGVGELCILLSSAFDAMLLTWVLRHRGKEGMVEVRVREAMSPLFFARTYTLLTFHLSNHRILSCMTPSNLD